MEKKMLFNNPISMILILVSVVLLAGASNPEGMPWTAYAAAAIIGVVVSRLDTKAKRRPKTKEDAADE
jgi:hypothetical protein